MKTILVPTDFSKPSINAVDYAVALAKKEKMKIVLLNSYYFVPPTSEIPMPADLIESMRIESAARLRALCEEITKHKKIKCEYISKYNTTLGAVLEAAKDYKAEMIIMGTKGASGMKEILIGSNTASVIEKAKCPVIAVPYSSTFGGIKKIVYASDYQASDVEDIKKVVAIAKLFKAKIEVLHVSDEEFNRYSEQEYLENFKNKVAKRIRYKGLSYKLVYGSPFETVLDKEISKSSADLVAMSTQRRNLIERIFVKSVTRKLAFHTEIPLLVFHHKQEEAVFV